MADQFPMPEPTVPVRPLTSFKSLSFDIFGTLIDWERAIYPRLQPLRALIPSNSPHKSNSNNNDDAHLEELFHANEVAVQAESPTMTYDQVLERAYLRLASQLGIPNNDNGTDDLAIQARAFGASVGDWPAFPDTVDAMRRLGRYYKLIALSNVDMSSFARTRAGPLKGVDFWRAYTAQEIGSYKPDLRNFEYMLRHIEEESQEEYGGEGRIRREEDLHVAQSLFHDHVPAKEMGMASVWINRRGFGSGSLTGRGPEIRKMHDDAVVGYGWRFGTLGEFADEVERQWGERVA